jgi:hypothetical protein
MVRFSDVPFQSVQGLRFAVKVPGVDVTGDLDETRSACSESVPDRIGSAVEERPSVHAS